MKTKMVVKVCMYDEKSRRKALKISAGTSGVESATLTGPEKDQVEVVGEGFDAVALTRKLGKNVAHTELVSFGEVKKDEAPAAAKAVDPTPQPPVVFWSHPPQWVHVCEVMAPPSYEYSSCNIL